ncbi:MBL fold metallo-hydrolase [Leptospira koniambonensis]|uniref:MBL fold metallo-hydrolase n=1 Tax=Leptospira koniambonensis TaxID=2484950 RepID=UPI003EBAED1D
MPNYTRKITFGSLLLFSLLTSNDCFLGAPIKKTAQVWKSESKQEKKFKNWEEVLSKPTRLEVTAFLTGNVFTGPSVLIDADNPKTPEKEKRDQWVPALSYLIKHPEQGYFLLDSGVPDIDSENRCDFSLIGPLFNTKCLSEPGRDTASQLNTLNISNDNLNFVLASHLHWDHIGGMKALRNRGPVRVLIHEEEAKDASKIFAVFHGYSSEALSVDFDLSILPKENFFEMPILGSVFDLYGDGSVWVISAKGHTEGEIAVLLNAASGPLLFTFDSSHLKGGFDNEVPPGFTVNKEMGTDIIRRMNSFVKKFPKTKVIYGHEPSQWGEAPVVKLTR